jgi:uncharacterized protein (UPF0371 family)
MLKSKDILIKKAKEVKRLRSEIDKDKNSDTSVDIYPQTEYEEGKKVLVFKDPLFSNEKRSTTVYSIFNGKWEFENIDDIDSDGEELHAVRFTPVKDNSNFILAFKSLKDRIEFIDSIYADHTLKQTGSGINLEKFANSKVLGATGGIIGLSILGYNLFKFLNKDNKKK